ncbi:hypothetical protein IPN41_03200 [Candidatus Falkowbacteria bacterium]|nr:MAG: hypothetical protein IPN41_03200 [Candidatus Falkowbacteria bacterium]
MDNNIGVDPKRVFGLHTDLVAKINAAASKGDELTILNLEACLKANEEQKKFNVKNVLKQDFPVIDRRFGGAMTEFKFTVPSDYNHEEQLKAFGKKYKKEFYFYNSDITDKNFAKVSNKLIPGKTYTVKIFPILQNVSSEDCMTFLKKQNAIFVGAQGISLLRDVDKEKFPIGKWTVSFDEKENLWKDADGGHGVPLVGRGSGGVWRFDLGYFGFQWGSVDCLVCFCDC